MDAVLRGWDIGMRRAVAIFLGVVAIAMLAGAAGGYLTRGTTTYVVSHPIILPVSHAAQPPLGDRTAGGYIPGL
jgi:hypothetical protein